MVSIDFGTLQTGSQGGSLVEDLDLEKVKRTMKKVKLLQELFKAMLKDGRDYGTMPNCGKPTLLKPGAEKILILLGLRPEFDVLDRYRELEHNLLQYQVKCRLYRGSSLIAEGLGSANTREVRYANMSVFDSDNTALKMAKKRAMIDATLLVSGLSDTFTQDVEDISDQAQERQADKVQKAEKPENSDTITKRQAGRIFGLSRGEKDTAQAEIVKDVLAQYGYNRTSEVKRCDYDRICAQVEAMANGEWDKLYEDEVRKLDGDMLRKLCSDGKSTNLI